MSLPYSRLLTLGLITALLAAGCGQKGNLYLPNQKKKVPAAQPSPNTQAQPDASPSTGSPSNSPIAPAAGSPP
jgi:predicted small lipoprotein YifL